MTDWASVAGILRCPASGGPLRLVSGEPDPVPPSWSALGERFGMGKPRGVLATEDGRYRYPAWDEVAGLLAEHASSDAPDARPAGELDRERLVNTRFYDEFGWLEGAAGVFNDALAFEDMRPVTHFYRRRCHRRVNRQLTGGKFLLDCASGAVQIPEYVSFSDTFERRICVDLSFAGLRMAKKRLGEKAICIVGDITRLPLRDGVADNFVSLHTVYHVPAGEQASAVAELHRVLKPAGVGVIVYAWPAPKLLEGAARLRAWLERRGWWKAPATTQAVPTPELYYHAHDHEWYRREVAERYGATLRVWRSVDKAFLEGFARGPLTAALVLWPLYLAEELFPGMFGRIGLCPMFILRKK